MGGIAGERGCQRGAWGREYRVKCGCFWIKKCSVNLLVSSFFAINMSRPASSASVPSTASAPAPAVTSAPAGTAPATGAQVRVPSASTMERAVRFAIAEDRPIIMDYWMDSLSPDPATRPFIGVIKGTKDSVLMKSSEEFTSHIAKMIKCDKAGTEHIIMTANSIYIVGPIIGRNITM